MRFIVAVFGFAAVLLAGADAHAEKRSFIIHNADGYGVDRCLMTGDACGSAIATAYCRSREFAQAVSFRKADREEITAVAPSGNVACRGGTCDQFVAIECTR